MKFTPYTFAAADFVGTSLACLMTLAAFLFLGWHFIQLFDPCERTPEFDEPADDARFEEPTREETGIAAEVAKLPPGSQLIECDTAGMLTPPGQVWVHEYVWTGKAIEFVRTVPLHEFSFRVPAPAAA